MSTTKNLPRKGRVENPEAARAAAERAFSGAWGTHDARPNRRRTRKTDRDASISEFR